MTAWSPPRQRSVADAGDNAFLLLVMFASPPVLGLGLRDGLLHLPRQSGRPHWKTRSNRMAAQFLLLGIAVLAAPVASPLSAPDSPARGDDTGWNRCGAAHIYFRIHFSSSERRWCCRTKPVSERARADGWRFRHVFICGGIHCYQGLSATSWSRLHGMADKGLLVMGGSRSHSRRRHLRSRIQIPRSDLAI